MPVPTVPYSLVEAVWHGKHDMSSASLKFVLLTLANTPVVTDAVLADLTPIDETNLASNTLAITSSGQTDGEYTLAITDKNVTADGGDLPAFEVVAVYNDSAASDELIGWMTLAAPVTLLDGQSRLIDFSELNGFIKNSLSA